MVTLSDGYISISQKFDDNVDREERRDEDEYVNIDLTFLICLGLRLHYQTSGLICIKNGKDLQGNYNYESKLDVTTLKTIFRYLHMARPRAIE